MKPRLCACGAPKVESWAHLCPDCRARSQAKRRWRDNSRRHEASTRSRGYGPEHQRLRRKWAPLVAAGGVNCARCSKPITPGAPWDLDHSEDRTYYLGVSHQKCNRQTASHRKEARERQKRDKSTDFHDASW
jgi:hypothetical protein